MKRALIGLAGLLGLVACSHAKADNHCPIGCVITPTIVTQTAIVQQTREPWVVAKPPTTSVTVTVTEHHAPSSGK